MCVWWGTSVFSENDTSFVISKNQLLLALSLLATADNLANTLDPDYERQNVGPDLDPNCLTL